MSSHCLKSRDPSYVGSAMWPKCLRKNRWGKSCWLHTQESGPEVDQGPGGGTTSPTLLGPVLMWIQQNYLKSLLTVKYLESCLGCCPSDPPQRKAGMKMNEYVILAWGRTALCHLQPVSVVLNRAMRCLNTSRIPTRVIYKMQKSLQK